MNDNVLGSALLFDTYGDMLTEKQRVCCDLKFNQDLSLGEIGELEGISRQAVRDNLVRAMAQMQELEDRLGLVNRSLRIGAAEAELRTALSLLQGIGPAAAEVSDHISRAISMIKE